MIARARILLPFLIPVVAGQVLEPYKYEHQRYQIRVYPPLQSVREVVTNGIDLARPDFQLHPRTLVELLSPSEPQQATPAVRINDQPSVQTDLLQIDFAAEDFNRAPEAFEPSREEIFSVATGFLERLRAANWAGLFMRLDVAATNFTIHYLNDDGSNLSEKPGLQRIITCRAERWKYILLDQSAWEATSSLPANYVPSRSDTLLLDAQALPPEIGPALVLAYVAVETRIASALGRLAETADVNRELWEWMNSRRREPSVEEQLTSLLRVIAKHSLIEDNDLWGSFQDLRKARNTFVHQGQAAINSNPVTLAEAEELIAQAKSIVDWIEALLPEAERGPRFKLANYMGLWKLEPSDTDISKIQSILKIRFGEKAEEATLPISKLEDDLIRGGPTD